MTQAQKGPFNFEEITSYIKKHTSVKLEKLEAGIRFQHNDMSVILSLVQKVNNRFGVDGLAPVYIHGGYIKYRISE